VVEIDVRQLRSFLAVAEELNITRAAARLHLAQQAVSVQVRQLERALEVDLLVRNSRGVALTPAGAVLAEGGRTIIADLDFLASRVAALANGGPDRLRLVCKPYTSTDLAIEVVRAVEEAVPGARVEVITASALPEELRLLADQEAEVAFMWLPLADDRLQWAEVGIEPAMVALPAGHRLAGLAEVTLADLAGEPMIVPAFSVPEASLRPWLAEPRPGGWPAPRGPATRRMEDNLPLIAAGRGIWIAPEVIAAHFGAPGVRWLPVADAEPFRLAVAWTSHAPDRLVRSLVCKVREITGWQAQDVDDRTIRSTPDLHAE
jgi:DNA-binding transcriptional LysR family regulator